jgi:hypothetical protein
MEKTGGNADVCENTGVVGKAIRKVMKAKGLKIHGCELERLRDL